MIRSEQTPSRQDTKASSTDRRGFLRLAAGGGTATLAAACGWDGGDAVRPGLLDVSRLNDWVGEHILFPPTRLARTYEPADRSASLPSYFISGVTPMLRDPAAWRLRVDGMVRQPLDLSLEDLQRMPRQSYTVKHHCVEGWRSSGWRTMPSTRRDRKSTRLNSSHLGI